MVAVRRHGAIARTLGCRQGGPLFEHRYGVFSNRRKLQVEKVGKKPLNCSAKAKLALAYSRLIAATVTGQYGLNLNPDDCQGDTLVSYFGINGHAAAPPGEQRL